MAGKLFPKLNHYETISVSWKGLEEPDPRVRGKIDFGLTRQDDDPPDQYILCVLDAAFAASLHSDVPSIYPADIAKRLKQDRISFREYLAQLEAMGLNLAQVQADATAKQSRYLQGINERKSRAATFFALLKSEWHVTDKQVKEHLDDESIYELLELVLANADETKARLNARRRHESTSEARKFVVAEWEKYRDDYRGNKTDFSKDYSARLLHEFKDAKGDPLKIERRTIREVWLADNPSASKRTG